MGFYLNIQKTLKHNTMLMTIYNRKLLWDWTTAKTDLDFRYEQTIWFIKTHGSIRYVFNGIGKLHFFLPVSFVLNTMIFREDKAGVRANWVQNTLTSYVLRDCTLLFERQERTEQLQVTFILTNRKNQRVFCKSCMYRKL